MKSFCTTQTQRLQSVSYKVKLKKERMIATENPKETLNIEIEPYALVL